MKEIRKEMWTVGRQQEIYADEGMDDNDDESIVSPLRVGDTITGVIETWLGIHIVKTDLNFESKYLCFSINQLEIKVKKYDDPMADKLGRHKQMNVLKTNCHISMKICSKRI